MLRNARFAPSWIEERKDIDAEVVVARTHLARGWMILQRARTNESEKAPKLDGQNILVPFDPRLHNLTAESRRGI